MGAFIGHHALARGAGFGRHGAFEVREKITTLADLMAHWGVDFAADAPLSQRPNMQFSRATAATVTDCYGNLLQCQPNELRIEGARRVENLVDSRYGTGWSPNGSASIATGDVFDGIASARLTTTATNSGRYQFVSSTPGELLFAQIIFKAGPSNVVRMGANESFLRVSINASPSILDQIGTQTGKGLTALGGGWWRAWLVVPARAAPATTTAMLVYLETVGVFDSLTMVERALPGQTEPSEYVSRGVLPAPWHGYGCDGVRYFNSYRNDDLLRGQGSTSFAGGNPTVSAPDSNGWVTLTKTTTSTSEGRVFPLSLNASDLPLTDSGAAFRMELLAGTSTVATAGMISNPGAWTAPFQGRVISGPGVIGTYPGALLPVFGLSATIPTVVELWRVYEPSQIRQAYIYPGGTTSAVVGHSIKVRNITVHAGARFPIGPMPAIGQTLSLPVPPLGALTEPAATNLFTISSPVTAEVIKAADVVEAPGFLNFRTSFRVSPNAATQFVYRTSTVPTTVHTISVYVVMDDGLPPAFQGESSITDFTLALNINPVPGPYLVRNIAGPVYRVSAAGAPPNTVNPLCGVIKRANYSNRSFRVTGIQIEAGDLVTSLIPTAGVAATRAADQLLANFAATWDQQQGTLYLDAMMRSKHTDKSSNLRPLSVYTSINDRLMILNTAAGAAQYGVTEGAAQPVLQGMPWAFGDRLKVAQALRANDAAMFANGVKMTGPATFAMPAVQNLHIGYSFPGGQDANPQVTRRVGYINRRVRDKDMQEITT